MRMGDRDVASGGVEGHRARVLAHPAADRSGRECGHEPRISIERDQGHTLAAGAFVLHRHDDAGVPVDIEMPDRQPAQPPAERGRAHRPTVEGVQHHERRVHRVQVQLRAAGIGMGTDPAVGDREPPAPAEHANLVRPHAVTRPLADPAPAPRSLPHPDRSVAVLEPILRRVEKPSVRAECAVPVETSAVGGGKELRHRARRGIENERPFARSPGEHDDVARRGLHRKPMAATGERHVVVDAAGLVEHRGQMSSLAVDPAADEAPAFEDAGPRH